MGQFFMTVKSVQSAVYDLPVTYSRDMTAAATRPRPEGADPVTPKGRRTRDALLRAGETVAERAGLSGLSIAAVAAQASVPKGTCYLYFEDRETFIDALH